MTDRDKYVKQDGWSQKKGTHISIASYLGIAERSLTGRSIGLSDLRFDYTPEQACQNKGLCAKMKKQRQNFKIFIK